MESPTNSLYLMFSAFLITKEFDIDSGKSFVVGDRIKGEITFGNQVGYQTIWVKAGAFSLELPMTKEEEPDFEVKKLKEILR